MASLDVPPLSGTLVRVEPLSAAHVPDLTEAAEENRGSYGFTWVPRAADVAAYVREQQERVGLTPFAQIRLADGKAVGCTAYWDLRTWADSDRLRAIEIGFTWLGASAQGTGINAEAKLLLFTYAFETLGVVRVDLKTDARNERSRRGDRRDRRAVRGRAPQLVTVVGPGGGRQAPRLRPVLGDRARVADGEVRACRPRRPGGRAQVSVTRRPGRFIVPGGQYQVMMSTVSRPACTAGSLSASSLDRSIDPVR